MASPEPSSARDTPPPSFSLRPWPTDGDRRPKNLAEFIARVNIERGGFRNVTEAGLRDEIMQKAEEEAAAAAAATQGQGDDVDIGYGEDGDSGESGTETDEEGDDKVKDALEAKAQIMRSLDVAQNTAMLTLDFISLLLSKESPAQAAQSFSPALREYVGIGTLGAGKITLPSDNAAANAYSTHPNPARVNNPARAADDEAVSAGWVIMEIDTARTAAASAASVLAAEAAREASYWADVMRVRDANWTLCRLPQSERHRATLGVQFGFREAAGEFRGGSWAPLRRDDEAGGAVVLDTGRLGAGSHRLVVTIERDGKIVGRSNMAPPLPADIPLEARVLEARNTIFAQELWHELHREGRGVHANGVRIDGSKLTWTMDRHIDVYLELKSPDDEANLSLSQAHTTPSDTALAEIAHLALYMLLSHAHRENEMRRLKPSPPHQPRTAPSHQTCLLIRPLLEHIVHRDHISKLLDFLGDLTATLHTAGFPDASFKLQTPYPASVSELFSAGSSGGTDRSSAPQTLISQLLSPRMLHVDVTITRTACLAVRSATSLSPVATVSYARPVPGFDGVNALAQSCPPAREYHTLGALCDYLAIAAQHSLIDYALSLISQQLPSANWTKDISGSRIRKMPSTDSETIQPTELAFRVGPCAGELKNNALEGDVLLHDVAKPNVQIVLVDISQSAKTGKLGKTRTVWTARGHGCHTESLKQVITRIIANIPRTSPRRQRDQLDGKQ